MTPVTRILIIIDRFRRREDAQGLAEYALILALIAIVAIVALLYLGSQISDKLSIVGDGSDVRFTVALSELKLQQLVKNFGSMLGAFAGGGGSMGGTP